MPDQVFESTGVNTVSAHKDGSVPDFLAGAAEEAAQYRELRRRVNARARRVVGSGAKIFTTDAKDLAQAFLMALPQDMRQRHTCRACAKFLDQFGGLVTIESDGHTKPVMWSLDTEGLGAYARAYGAMYDRVRWASVTGVFLTALMTWGQPVTGDWSHLSVELPNSLFTGALPYRSVAETAEEHRLVREACETYSSTAIKAAEELLTSDQLWRAEKFLGPVMWLQTLKASMRGVRNHEIRDNLLWRAVATAPTGFCHIKTSMVGTLLDDLMNRLPIDQVKRRWSEKVHPMNYQRPKAPPSDGNIEAGERIIEKLGLARSLERRFASIEDVKMLWTPPTAVIDDRRPGVFEHLRQPAPTEVRNGGSSTMSWRKFAETTLPNAREIEIVMFGGRYNFCQLVTAKHPDAPPILQWDHQEARNPVSWYVYSGGSTLAAFNIRHHTNRVIGICRQPSRWNNPEKFEHFGDCVVLLIEGCRDTGNQGGLGLFPELLIPQLREVRSTIEAYSQSKRPADAVGVPAAGIRIEMRGSQNTVLRVTTECWRSEITIDRWE